MFDFPFQEPVVLTSLYCIISYFFIVKYGYGKFIHNNVINITRSFSPAFTYLFFVLVATHAINGDFFHLMNIVHNYEFVKGANISQESLYPFLAKIVGKNYLLFRFILWGLGVICVWSIFKRFGLNKYFALWFFLSGYLIIFTYARAAVAASVYFFGISLLAGERHLNVTRMLGLLIIIMSFQFHRSMLILIALTPFLFLPINKKTVYIVIVLMPLIIMLVRMFFSSALNEIAIFDDEMLERKMMRYSEAEGQTQSLREIIMNTIRYTSIYLPFLISTYYIVIKGHINEIKGNVKSLYYFTFWLFVATTAVSYLNVEIDIFFYRMLFMTIIPSTVIFVYLIQKGIVKVNVVNRVLFFCVFAQSIAYLYMLYLNVHK